MNDRRAIFSLIAMGRITPEEAERLLAIANEPTETVMVLAACVAAVLMMQIHGHDLLSQLAHLLRVMLPNVTAANVANVWLGGLV